MDSIEGKVEKLADIITKTDLEFWEKRNKAMIELTNLVL